MSIPRSLRRWLPGRAALMLGLGALSIASTRADTPGDNEHKSFDDVLVRSEAGRIYLSEGDRETELRLSATPQRDYLLRLLQEHGPSGVRVDPLILAGGGGGTGFSLWDIRKSVTKKPAIRSQDPPNVTAPPPSPPDLGSVPRDQGRITEKKE